MIINKIFKPKSTPIDQSEGVVENVKRSLLKRNPQLKKTAKKIQKWASNPH